MHKSLLLMQLITLLLFTSSHSSYDPQCDSWERLADMQEIRSNFSLLVHEEHLYAIGGDKNINTNVDSVETYNPDRNTWRYDW